MGYDQSQNESYVQTQKVEKRIDELQGQVGTLATIATIIVESNELAEDAKFHHLLGKSCIHVHLHHIACTIAEFKELRRRVSHYSRFDPHKNDATKNSNSNSKTQIMQIALLLSLLLIILYILEMICGSPSKRPLPPPLPTAVVIQKKDEDEKKKRRSRRVPDECRHTLNRSFPSKKVMLELDVKRPDIKEKEAKEKLAVEVLKIPLGAPPPYAESGKSVTGDRKIGAVPAFQLKSSAATGVVGSTISCMGTTSLPVSATQETTSSRNRTAVLPSPAFSQPSPLDPRETPILSGTLPRSKPEMGLTLGQPSPKPVQPVTRTVLPPAKSPRKGRRRTAVSPRRSRKFGSGTSDQASFSFYNRQK